MADDNKTKTPQGVTLEGTEAYQWKLTPTGATGTFITADVPAKTITVRNGVITSIV
jgi:hypothetical protein